jgi:predicted deacylase
MKHRIKISYLAVGHIGSLPIRVPITTIGKGAPHLAILCSMHGNETASLVISQHFVKELMRTDSLSGSVSIITAANPFAQATRSRVLVSDYLDLNRIERGQPDGTLTERLAHTLYQFLSKCSFVIDLHEFIMQTPTMAIYIPSSDHEVDQRILQGIAAFSPSLVWAMNFDTSQETKYSRGLLATLIHQQRIPGFGVETSRLVELTSATIHQAAEGLVEVAKLMGIIEGQCRISTPPAFVRKPMYSSQAGIWIPKATLLNSIKEGGMIGEITSLDLKESIPIVSDIEGPLIQLASADLVDTGTSLFTIGIQNPDLTAKFAQFYEALAVT